HAQELAAYVREHAIPVPIATLTCGEVHRGKSVWASRIAEESNIVSFKVGLRQVMRDPGLDGVSHDPDGSSPKTILSVFGQNTFMRAVKEVVHGVFTAAEQLIGEPDIKGVVALINCSKGCHRSNALGRATKECLNYVHNGDGSRVFNVKCFHMFNLKASEHQRVTAQAKQWATRPWATIAEPLDRGYAFDAASQRIESQQNYDEMWSTMAGINRNQETETGNWALLAGTPPARATDLGDAVAKTGPTPPTTAPPAYLNGGAAAAAATSAATPKDAVTSALQAVALALQAQQTAPPPAVPAAPPPISVPKMVQPTASPLMTAPQAAA
ncbi:unnamed protein product, partial [Prorocentrum cordatum]